jgi:hypothetical protein
VIEPRWADRQVHALPTGLGPVLVDDPKDETLVDRSHQSEAGSETSCWQETQCSTTNQTSLLKTQPRVKVINGVLITL